MKLFKLKMRAKTKGVLRFFSVLYCNFFDLVMLNFAFILAALPVFTLGAAYKALVEVCLSFAKGRTGAPIRSFFKAFCRGFLKSTLYGIFFCLLFTIIAFAGVFYYNLAQQFEIFYFACTLSIAVIITLLMMTCYFFPLYIETKSGFLALFSGSFLLVFANIKGSALYLLSACVCAFVTLALFPHSLPLVLALPFSLTALVSGFAANEKTTKIFIQNHRKESRNDSGHFSP